MKTSPMDIVAYSRPKMAACNTLIEPARGHVPVGQHSTVKVGWTRRPDNHHSFLNFAAQSDML
jgi:hypothetical protein